jgi:hypothetical protein
MAEDPAPWARYGETFWRAHHEAWKRSDLNQREYCEAQGLSLKAFGNGRAKFKARVTAAGAQAALPARCRKSQPWSHRKSQPWSRDLSLFRATRSHRSAAARGSSATVQ